MKLYAKYANTKLNPLDASDRWHSAESRCIAQLNAFGLYIIYCLFDLRVWPKAELWIRNTRKPDILRSKTTYINMQNNNQNNTCQRRIDSFSNPDVLGSLCSCSLV